MSMKHIMGAFEINLNPIVFLFIILGSAVIGYVFRSRQIKSARKKILALEKEMLTSHAQILALQGKISDLTAAEKPNIPVIPLKTVSSGEEKKAK